MALARKLIEGIDDPEEFDVKGHLMSPVARLARTNGFVRKDRNPAEERWVKKLRNGNEAWLVSDTYGAEMPIDWRDLQRHGGRNWNFILVRKIYTCSICSGTGREPGGDSCQPCNNTGKQKTPRLDYETLATANEMTMDYLLGAFLQRLATWPKNRPKPGDSNER